MQRMRIKHVGAYLVKVSTRAAAVHEALRSCVMSVKGLLEAGVYDALGVQVGQPARNICRDVLAVGQAAAARHVGALYICPEAEVVHVLRHQHGALATLYINIISLTLQGL